MAYLHLQVMEGLEAFSLALAMEVALGCCSMDSLICWLLHFVQELP